MTCSLSGVCHWGGRRWLFLWNIFSSEMMHAGCRKTDRKRREQVWWLLSFWGGTGGDSGAGSLKLSLDSIFSGCYRPSRICGRVFLRSAQSPAWGSFAPWFVSSRFPTSPSQLPLDDSSPDPWPARSYWWPPSNSSWALNLLALFQKSTLSHLPVPPAAPLPLAASVVTDIILNKSQYGVKICFLLANAVLWVNTIWLNIIVNVLSFLKMSLHY